jgi:nanoRNase/pAp phosphatase (c-di-AMP/oligoRNAs hydrolase)
MKNRAKTACALLGVADIIPAIARELKAQGKSVVLVEEDEKRIEALRASNFEVLKGRASTAVFELIGKLGVDCALILDRDFKLNKKAVKYFKEQYPSIHIVTRASTVKQKEALERLGADLVIHTPSLIENTILWHLEKIDSMKRAKELLNIIGEIGKNKKLAIVLHDNPDPDALASAMALKAIAASIGVDSEVLYNGEINQRENRAFVDLLKIKLSRLNKSKLKQYGKIALVDNSIPSIYNALPEGYKVDIVIDHHPTEAGELCASFVDIRSNIGSTSTIMTKYLQALDIQIGRELAAALLHGIRIDTLDFRRDTHPADLEAAGFLYPIADHELLEKIEATSISLEHADALADAIRNKRIIDSCLFSNVGFLNERDVLPQAADFLLYLEGITMTAIYGIIENNLHICARSRNRRIYLGKMLKEAFADIGSAGGHYNVAAALIPLSVFPKQSDDRKLLELVDELVVKRFLAALKKKLQLRPKSSISNVY